jgi:hypothetical protein
MNIIFPKTCTAVSLALSVCAVSIAFADDASPPVALEVRDVVPATGCSADAVADVLGLRIGMSFVEYEAALPNVGLPLLEHAEKIPDATKFGPQRLGFVAQEGEVAPTFTWKDGFKMVFQPIQASAGLTMYAEQVDATGKLGEFATGQYLWVSFGGPSVGARVQEVRRSQKLDEAVDTEAMLASIAKKYGPASQIKSMGTSWIDIAYYYKDGQLVGEGDRRRVKFSLYCKPPSTTGGTPDILYSDVNAAQWFGNWRDPRASKDECDANTFVRLYFGDRPNTIDALDVTIIDNVARWENANAIAVQAEVVHTEWLKSVAGSTTAPDL